MGKYRSREFNERVLRLANLDSHNLSMRFAGDDHFELSSNEANYMIIQSKKLHLDQSPTYAISCSEVLSRTRNLDSSIKVRLAYAHACYQVEKIKYIIREIQLLNDEQTREDTQEIYRYRHHVNQPNRSKFNSLEPCYLTSCYPVIDRSIVENKQSYKIFTSIDCQQAPLEAIKIATHLVDKHDPNHRIHYAQLGHLTLPYPMKNKDLSKNTLILNIPSQAQRQSTLNLGLNDLSKEWDDHQDTKNLIRHLYGLKPMHKVLDDEQYIKQLICVVGSNDGLPSHCVYNSLIIVADSTVHSLVVRELKKEWKEPLWATRLGQHNGILTSVVYKEHPKTHFKLAPRSGRIISAWERRS
jgi:hypothetical protein